VTHAISVVLRFFRTALEQIRALLAQIRALRQRVKLPAWAKPWLAVAKGVACVAIAAVAVITLWGQVHQDRQITAQVLRPASVHQGVTDNDRWQCIYRAIRAAVPEGSTVDVNFPENLVYFQRMAELSTDWAVPQRTVGGAQWRLLIYRTHGYCSGLAVAVQRP
jgi:hypothetical protein